MRPILVLAFMFSVTGQAAQTDTDQFVAAACADDLKTMAIVEVTSVVDLNGQNSSTHETALTCAVKAGASDVIDFLAKGRISIVDPNIPNGNGERPLTILGGLQTVNYQVVQALADDFGARFDYQANLINGLPITVWPIDLGYKMKFLKYLPYDVINVVDASGQSILTQIYQPWHDGEGARFTDQYRDTRALLISLLGNPQIALQPLIAAHVNLLADWATGVRATDKLEGVDDFFQFLVQNSDRLKPLIDTSWTDSDGESMLAVVSPDRAKVMLSNFDFAPATLQKPDNSGASLCQAWITDDDLFTLLKARGGLTATCAGIAAQFDVPERYPIFQNAGVFRRFGYTDFDDYDPATNRALVSVYKSVDDMGFSQTVLPSFWVIDTALWPFQAPVAQFTPVGIAPLTLSDDRNGFNAAVLTRGSSALIRFGGTFYVPNPDLTITVGSRACLPATQGMGSVCFDPDQHFVSASGVASVGTGVGGDKVEYFECPGDRFCLEIENGVVQVFDRKSQKWIPAVSIPGLNPYSFYKRPVLAVDGYYYFAEYSQDTLVAMRASDGTISYRQLGQSRLAPFGGEYWLQSVYFANILSPLSFVVYKMNAAGVLTRVAGAYTNLMVPPPTRGEFVRFNPASNTLDVITDQLARIHMH